ncbi:MAG: hypothetical protein CL424_20220 [Acidimicrobiaceae bacterium]|nr:hypothetical protein [Acidimicrobiaceae bacterium]
MRSPFTRAVVPVLGGIAVIGVIGVFLWGMAAWISRGGAEATERIAPSELTVGPVESLADEVAENGPLFFPELGTAIGTRSIVVDHTGSVAADGWRVYWAYPADREPSCVVEQVIGTSAFVDCDGREIDVAELSPPDAGVFPRVDGRETLVIDLRSAARP